MSGAAEIDAGGWRAGDYARNARFVAELATDLIDWLAPAPGETILDLGCGDGALTERIAAAGADMVGVDGSASMVAAARERGLTAVVADARALGAVAALDRAFDAVFSNAALHWMHDDPQAVIEHVFARLKPGGRFVAEMGASGNVAPIRAVLRAEADARGHEPDTLDPWYFPTETAYLDRLATAGFHIERSHTFERPTQLPGDIADWLTTLARPFVTAFAHGAARDAYVAAVRERLAGEMRHRDGQWVAPYVRLRFIARKPD
ncbi:methyltransferase domain-containing protein [Salinisphaera sp.]|uniref:methyltransferase domain-containing protein n=1 Tax=Salinisphaera sp. TaxID=1914330 RepID=UPI002D773140|nr:methyltransferase domain-containing protein [Salinisphaera sp.]HET7315306.1 methyltransferase domain-containing protein [Salinisphaera sp.]